MSYLATVCHASHIGREMEQPRLLRWWRQGSTSWHCLPPTSALMIIIFWLLCKRQISARQLCKRRMPMSMQLLEQNFPAYLWNTLGVSAYFPASVNADSLHAVSRAKKLGCGELGQNADWPSSGFLTRCLVFCLNRLSASSEPGAQYQTSSYRDIQDYSNSKGKGRYREAETRRSV